MRLFAPLVDGKKSDFMRQVKAVCGNDVRIEDRNDIEYNSLNAIIEDITMTIRGRITAAIGIFLRGNRAVKKTSIAFLLLLTIFSCTTDGEVNGNDKRAHTLFGGKIMYNGTNFVEPELNGTHLDGIFILITNCENGKEYTLRVKDGVFVETNIAPGKYRIDFLMLFNKRKSVSWKPSVHPPDGEFTILPNCINITGRMYWNCEPPLESLFFTNIEYEEVRSYFDEYVKNNGIGIDKWNYVTIKT